MEIPGLLSNSYLCDFLTVSTDRPLPRFQGENSPVSGTDDDIGIGDNAIAKDPSGAYFLGLPLFFFISGAYFLGLPLFFFISEPVSGPGGAATGAESAAEDCIVAPAYVVGFPVLGAKW